MDVAIDGVKAIGLDVHVDARGSLVEFYRQEWLPTPRPALQGNVSRSAVGVLRGMHFHRSQWDFWFAVTGIAFVALADLRQGSPTNGATATLRLAGDEPRGLYIPPGVAHGFFAETEYVMQYLVDAYHDGTDEHGLAWDDPTLAIAWPSTEPTLSDRDRENPTLGEVLLNPPSYRGLVG